MYNNTINRFGQDYFYYFYLEIYTFVILSFCLQFPNYSRFCLAFALNQTVILIWLFIAISF